MPQVHIIGLPVSKGTALDKPALQALQQAQLVIGSKRQLALLASCLLPDQKQHELPKLSGLEALIKPYQHVAVLASGDPLYYGIGRWFYQHFPAQNIKTYPALSSIQAACHALGLSLQDVDVMSLHGRPLQTIRTRLKQNQTLLVLTDRHSTPQILAQECIAAGFDQSLIWVCENLGYEQQNITRYPVNTLQNKPMAFDPLHVSVIKTAGKGGVLPEFPGIPDHHFVTDGKKPGSGLLTKREVRLQILSLMQVANNDVVWDIGAGCGGVAVELAFWNARAQVYAVEHHAQRLRCIEANRKKFGVLMNLNVVAGRAPDVLADLPEANKVFIGGSDSELENLLNQTWQQLPVGGVLVASAVTETSKQSCLAFADNHLEDADMESVQIAVSKGDRLAGQMLYRPRLPVTLFKWVKAHGE